MALRHPVELESNLIMPKDEARAFFDREIQRLMGMSGAEFIQRWESGEYEDLEDVPETRHVLKAAFLIPFGQSNS